MEVEWREVELWIKSQPMPHPHVHIQLNDNLMIAFQLGGLYGMEFASPTKLSRNPSIQWDVDLHKLHDYMQHMAIEGISHGRVLNKEEFTWFI